MSSTKTSVQEIDYKKFIFPMEMSDDDIILYRRFAKGMEVYNDGDGNNIPNTLRFFDGFEVVSIRLQSDTKPAEIIMERPVQ